MRRFKKFIIWFLIILAAFVVIIFIAASVVVNRYKPDLENALTQNIGLETRIDGPIALKILPGISLVANDLKIISNETYIFRVSKIEISLDYLKLLSSEYHVKALHFIEPQLYIVRDKDGVFNYHQAYAGLPGMNSMEKKDQIALDELTIENGKIVYSDMEMGDSLMAGGIYLESDDMNLPGTIDNIDPTKISFSGNVEVNSFKLNMLLVDSLHFKVEGRNGKISIQPEDKTYFMGESKGKAIIDFTQKPVFVHIQHQLTGLDVGEFQEAIAADELLFGKLNTSLDISFQSFDWDKAIKSMKGEIKLSGNNLLMQGLNLDQALDIYEATNEFSVSDLSAVFIVGPYGAVFAKGINYAALMNTEPGDVTNIKKFVSNWKIKNGTAALRICHSKRKMDSASDLLIK